MEQHTYLVTEIRVGKKGQVTIPKKIRDEDNLQEDDAMIVTHMPGGDIILRKRTIKTPEDRMLDIINTLPKIDARKAWKEIIEERKKEHR